MTFLLDTANLHEIEESLEYLPISGVTTNPSILKREGQLAVFEHFRKIRDVIGSERTLHIQVVSTTPQTMLAEVERILEQVDRDVYVKIPVTQAGLAVMKELKGRSVHITATAIYSAVQGFLAIEAGADFLAPYYNRMENLGIDAYQVIQQLSSRIQQQQSPCQILGASYKNIAQVNRTFEAGGHAVTVDPNLLRQALTSPPILDAVSNFKADWESVYGANQTLLESE